MRNLLPGPASDQDAMGQGLERPFDVKFGPDGAMYIVDYGVARVNLTRLKEDHFPAEFPRKPVPSGGSRADKVRPKQPVQRSSAHQ